jgi:protein-arginine kinase activator protein McsA
VSNKGDENCASNRKKLAARLTLEEKAKKKILRLNKKKELLSKIAKRSHNDNEKMVTCPDCNMTAWPEQVKKKICCKIARKILKPIIQVSEDVFSAGRVINGGGYGMGKSRKH